jgi:hypothetical protein
MPVHIPNNYSFLERIFRQAKSLFYKDYLWRNLVTIYGNKKAASYYQRLWREMKLNVI